jgi:hypothetical protein
VHTADADWAGTAVVGTTGPGTYMMTGGWSPASIQRRMRVTDGQVNSRTAVQFLGAIAGELESRGLMVRPSHRQGMVTRLPQLALYTLSGPRSGSVMTAS